MQENDTFRLGTPQSAGLVLLILAVIVAAVPELLRWFL